MTALLYHWAPVSRRRDILQYGLSPHQETSFHTGGHTSPYLCFAYSPSAAWSLSIGAGVRDSSEDEDWDLWQVSLPDGADVRPLPYFEGQNTPEVRTYSSIPASEMWLVATRHPESFEPDESSCEGDEDTPLYRMPLASAAQALGDAIHDKFANLSQTMIEQIVKTLSDKGIYLAVESLENIPVPGEPRKGKGPFSSNVTAPFSSCPTHGDLDWVYITCPQCGAPTYSITPLVHHTDPSVTSDPTNNPDLRGVQGPSGDCLGGPLGDPGPQKEDPWVKLRDPNLNQIESVRRAIFDPIKPGIADSTLRERFIAGRAFGAVMAIAYASVVGMTAVREHQEAEKRRVEGLKDARPNEDLRPHCTYPGCTCSERCEVNHNKIMEG